MGSSLLAARRSPLAAGHSPLAPRPGDLTPPDNSQRARPLSAQITNTFRPPCSRLSRRSFSHLGPGRSGPYYQKSQFPPWPAEAQLKTLKTTACGGRLNDSSSSTVELGRKT